MARQASPQPRPDALAALERRVEAADAARDDLRAATRAAHEAAQELAAEMRACQDLTDGKALAGRVEHLLGDAVAEGLARYQAAVDKAIKNAEEAVYRRFDSMIASLLGDDTDQPLEVTLRRFRDRQQLLEAGLARASVAAGVPVEDARLTAGGDTAKT